MLICFNSLIRFRIHPLSLLLKINTGNIIMFINTESRGALAIVQGGLCQIDKKILNIDYHPASLMAIVQTDQSCSFITNRQCMP